MKKTFLTLVLASTAALAACSGSGADPSAANAEVVEQLSDAALQDNLRATLKDVYFVSESDYPYVAFEGDVVDAKALTEKLVREKLAAAVLKNNSAERNINLPDCRADTLDVGQAIAEGEATVVDPKSDDFGYQKHAKQLGLALKTMQSQLNGVVGFTFGENESGDMDEVGTVLYVYVGISKTTGKLVAIMTEAVYT